MIWIRESLPLAPKKEVIMNAARVSFRAPVATESSIHERERETHTHNTHTHASDIESANID